MKFFPIKPQLAAGHERDNIGGEGGSDMMLTLPPNMATWRRPLMITPKIADQHSFLLECLKQMRHHPLTFSSARRFWLDFELSCGKLFSWLSWFRKLKDR